MSVGPEDLVAALAEVVAALGRMETRQEKLAGEVQAAADRAETAAQNAAASADAVTGTARAALTKVTSLAQETQAIERVTAKLEAVQEGLTETPVPSWRWLLGSAAAGAVLAVIVEAAMWPALAPWLTPAPVVVSAPAVQAPPREPERAHGRETGSKRKGEPAS